jgi:hypothetical protein
MMQVDAGGSGSSEDSAAEVTIHGLWSGLPVCGFTGDGPLSWPDGDRWLNSSLEKNWDTINCPECQRRHSMEKAEALNNGEGEET